MSTRDIVIQTDRLLLLVPSMDDCGALHELWSDPETMKYIGAGGVWTRAQIEERLQRAMRTQQEHGMTFWTIIERASGSIVGQGGLVPIEFDGPEIELGYRLGKEHWGKGYATEIARASAAYGFDTLGVDELVAVCYEENLPSRRVLHKAGFHEVGESDLYYGVRTIVHRMTKDGAPGIR